MEGVKKKERGEISGKKEKKGERWKEAVMKRKARGGGSKGGMGAVGGNLNGGPGISGQR